MLHDGKGGDLWFEPKDWPATFPMMPADTELEQSISRRGGIVLSGYDPGVRVGEEDGPDTREVTLI